MLLLYIITLLNDFLLDAIYVVSSTYPSIFYFFFLCRPLLILYKYPYCKKVKTNYQLYWHNQSAICFYRHSYCLLCRTLLPSLSAIKACTAMYYIAKELKGR